VQKYEKIPSKYLFCKSEKTINNILFFNCIINRQKRRFVLTKDKKNETPAQSRTFYRIVFVVLVGL
jgi:hypothetical protein